MTEQELQEGNKLIAEFMGMKFTHVDIDSHNFEQYSYTLPPKLSMDVYGYEGSEAYLDNQFSSSWDWLMPVVEKIDSIVLHEGLKENVTTFQVTITRYWCEIEMNSQYGAAFPEVDFDCIFQSNECKRNATYQAVVAFIKWYYPTPLIKTNNSNEYTCCGRDNL